MSTLIDTALENRTEITGSDAKRLRLKRRVAWPQGTRWQWPEMGSGRWTRPDVQAAVTVVGRRAVNRDIQAQPIDLYRAVLISANLRGANLRGVTLRGATLRRADLRDAILGDADLRGVTLRDARCDGADLTGAKWPKSAPLPEGWKLGAGSDRLERQATATSSLGPAAAN
jgi:hypothetical protein